MKPEHLQIIQHSLGVNEFGLGEQFRNHYCAGGDDVAACREMVALGFMAERESVSWVPYPTFCVTNRGKAAMVDASPEPPALTRAERRYRAFLRSPIDISFGDWLKRYGREVA